jgi:hypothetical protein
MTMRPVVKLSTAGPSEQMSSCSVGQMWLGSKPAVPAQTGERTVPTSPQSQKRPEGEGLRCARSGHSDPAVQPTLGGLAAYL